MNLHLWKEQKKLDQAIQKKVIISGMMCTKMFNWWA